MRDAPLRLLLVGRYPPPYGGITVHLQRLSEQLPPDVDVTSFDPYAAGILGRHRFGALALVAYAQLLAAHRFDIVHFHTSGMARFARVGLPLLLIARAFGVARIVTIHGGGFVARHRTCSAVARLRLRALLRLCDHVVAVNREQRAFLRDPGGVELERISVIPAFLRPPAASIAPAGAWARTLQRWRVQGRRVLCSSGEGLPPYGFHALVEAAREVDAELPCALLIAVNHRRDEQYLQTLVDEAGNLPLIILRDLAPADFVWLVRHCDAYLRCSDRDGDAVAIREALYTATPVIASDCVERPEAVTTYPTGEPRALRRTIATVLAGAPAARRRGEPCQDFLADLRTVYTRVAQR